MSASGFQTTIMTPPCLIVCARTPLQARSCGASSAKSPATNATWATCRRWPTRLWWKSSSRTAAARQCDGKKWRSRHSDPALPHPARPSPGRPSPTGEGVGNTGAPTAWRSRAEMWTDPAWRDGVPASPPPPTTRRRSPLPAVSSADSLLIHLSG